ncbi:MAG: nucleoside monophosphate kinase [Clostridia bacterium]|nr:nucleoside monophosphate kinase [Clostridia bacterium]
MIYVMMGGPATGKGTRSKILSKELNIPHISTGTMLREEATQNEELAKVLSEGKLVSDDLVNKALYKRLKRADCKNGFVLDGYPRNLEQAYALEAMMRKLNMEITEVLELVIPRALAFKRILERRECPNCKKVYGVDFPPKDGKHCDNCGSELFARADDTEETLTKRIEIYERESKPILDYYRKKGILKTVDSSRHPEKVMETI